MKEKSTLQMIIENDIEGLKKQDERAERGERVLLIG